MEKRTKSDSMEKKWLKATIKFIFSQIAGEHTEIDKSYGKTYFQTEEQI